MRANPAIYSLTAPPTLADLLSTLQEHPGKHTLIAGGTELMVAFNTGRLPPKPLLSLAHLPELRFIRQEPGCISLGAATTFTDIRRSEAISLQLPLLAQAASWTGSIANQNRGTVGGNIINASPAADTPPVLLVYGAELHLQSASGTRTVPYADFHHGYKRTALAPDEILHSISVPCDWPGYATYLRKVGTRNAQAISKVVLAGVAQSTVSGDSVTLTDLRLATASLADRPIQLSATEATLLDGPVDASAIARAKFALIRETAPIDDIRSTAAYRSQVAANLLEEFLTGLRKSAATS